MNFTQKLLLLASSMGLTSGVALAQTNTIFFEFETNSVANYRQGPNGTAFEGATFGMNVRDGNFFYTLPCDFPFFTFANGLCAPGTTGWVSRGLENDPLLRGLGPYFTVRDIAPSVLIAPFNPSAVRLVAAPPSLLPRPLLGFEDRSLNVFFNLTTNFIRQYTISVYNFGREYAAGERARFDGEVVPGTYRYNFPSIRNTATFTAPPVVLEANKFPVLDGYRKVNNQPQGLRFTNVTYDDDFAVLDPFALNTLTWDGNTSSFIAPGIDLAYLSIKRLTDPSDPLSDPDLEATPLFPSFSGAFDARVLLPSPLDKSFILPPNFVLPGETGVIDLEFVMFRPTSSLIYENSTRRFRMPVKVTDPFGGFITAALPPGATAAQKAASFDYDGDGVSNFDEWVFRSNPAQSNSVPKAPAVSIKPATIGGGPSTGLFSVQNTLDTASQGAMEYKVPKITNPVPKLRYAIEYSADMVTWTTIAAGNPDWTLVETLTEIKVTATGVNPKTGGFFRTKVQALN